MNTALLVLSAPALPLPLPSLLSAGRRIMCWIFSSLFVAVQQVRAGGLCHPDDVYQPWRTGWTPACKSRYSLAWAWQWRSTLLGDALGCRYLTVLGCGKSCLDPFRIMDNCISHKKILKRGLQLCGNYLVLKSSVLLSVVQLELLLCPWWWETGAADVSLCSLGPAWQPPKFKLSKSSEEPWYTFMYYQSIQMDGGASVSFI